MNWKPAVRAFFTILLEKDYVYADHHISHVYGRPQVVIEQINKVIELANDGIMEIKVLQEAQDILKQSEQ